MPSHRPTDPPANKMRAVVWEGKPFHMSVKSVSKPAIQRPEDVIVRVSTAAICGTDLHTYHGIFGSTNAPWTMGHEGIGVIEAVGSAVNSLSVGDRVVVPDFSGSGHLITDPNAILSFSGIGLGADFGSTEGLQGKMIHVRVVDAFS
jgi:threonine dehydrogenase-like Zn-dependent dehydrogenase